MNMKRTLFQTFLNARMVLVLVCAGAARLSLAQAVPGAAVASVEVTAVSERTFCLHVSFSSLTPKKSLFINPDLYEKRIPAETTKDGPFNGVKTGAGQLLVEREKKQWTLKDGAGRVIIPHCRFRPAAHTVRNNCAFVRISRTQGGPGALVSNLPSRLNG
jgi:hypothetical protein